MSSLEADCPCCHKHLEEYLQSIPPNKWISVDVELDALEVEWTGSIRELKAILRYLNSKRNRIKLGIIKGLEKIAGVKEMIMSTKVKCDFVECPHNTKLHCGKQEIKIQDLFCQEFLKRKDLPHAKSGSHEGDHTYTEHNF